MSGESQSLDNISVLVYMYYEVRKPQKTLKPPWVLLAQSPLVPGGSVALSNFLQVRLQQLGNKHQKVFSETYFLKVNVSPEAHYCLCPRKLVYIDTYRKYLTCTGALLG